MSNKKPKPKNPSRNKPDARSRKYITAGAIAAMVVLAVIIGYGATREPANRQAAAPPASGSQTASGQNGEIPAVKGVFKRVFKVQTSKGLIVVETYPSLMPKTVNNFDKLASEEFYNGLTFHRVEDWVIQGGDPKGDGSGGPGWTIPLETNPDLKNVRGAVAMARADDPDSAGSQFYILKKDASWLDGKYAVFGKVIEGMEVVDQIEPGDKMVSIGK